MWFKIYHIRLKMLVSWVKAVISYTALYRGLLLLSYYSQHAMLMKCKLQNTQIVIIRNQQAWKSQMSEQLENMSDDISCWFNHRYKIAICSYWSHAWLHKPVCQLADEFWSLLVTLAVLWQDVSDVKTLSGKVVLKWHIWSFKTENVSFECCHSLPDFFTRTARKQERTSASCTTNYTVNVSNSSSTAKTSHYYCYILTWLHVFLSVSTGIKIHFVNATSRTCKWKHHVY